MVSEVSICNQALDELGQSPIVSLHEKTKAARLCNRHYAVCRDQLLRMHPWNFAMQRATLLSTTQGPVWGDLYSHPLPNDFLRLLRVDNQGPGDYSVEGNAILSTAVSINIGYVRRVTDPTLFDPLFVKTLALLIALKIKGALVKNVALKKEIKEEYRTLLRTARTVDAQENPILQDTHDAWLFARH